MGLKRVSNLIKRADLKAVHYTDLLTLREKSNPKFLKGAALKLNDSVSLSSLVNHFIRDAKNGNVDSKLFLNAMVSEKVNKNNNFRKRILQNFWKLSRSGDSFGLRGLLAGVRDSSKENRYYALMGLGKLAERGDLRTLPGLLFGVKDSEGINRDKALHGLRDLVLKGEERTLPGLILGARDSDRGNRYWAFEGLKELAKRGNKEAIKALNALVK